MAYSLARRGRGSWPCASRLHASLASRVCGLPLTRIRSADIDVILDQAKLVKLPERVATIVIGNPLIADATVQAGGLMVITGKGYGRTNLIALDRTGAVLMEKTVEVQGPRAGIVVVYRGVERESYSCTPDCERRITLGDGQTLLRRRPSARPRARNGQAAK